MEMQAADVMLVVVLVVVDARHGWRRRARHAVRIVFLAPWNYYHLPLRALTFDSRHALHR